MCIGIEALLTNDSIEIAHKIATRGAAALTRHRKPPIDPAIAFKMLKAVCSRRSDLVHGNTKAKNVEFKVNENTRFRTVELASFVLRDYCCPSSTAQQHGPSGASTRSSSRHCCLRTTAMTLRKQSKTRTPTAMLAAQATPPSRRFP